MRGRGIVGLILIVVVVVAVYAYFTAVNPITRYIKEGLDLKGGVHVVLQATGPATLADMKKAETIIAFRANKFGISEPAIQLQGNNQIVADLAGVKDQQAAIKMIGQTAQLTFKAPNGSVILTGKDLTSASASLDQAVGPIVNLQFNAAGTRAFAQATKTYLNKTISIYLDKSLIESPTVQQVITGGQAMISGGFSNLTQAQQMANLLNSGALPIPMHIIEAQTVSPTLGQDSVARSAIAGLVSMALIILIMLGIYRYAGLIADIALSIYLIIVVGALISFGAVLTLPGVAGIILSAAIAVDANVIIFARIRDELRAGRTIGAAIDHGFKNALRAIMDSNVSTVIAASVLYYFGTGEVRGFAVTLIIGVLASFVTAVGVTRYLLRLSEGTVLVRNPKLFLG
ncbi:MAG: protein translocase subunit SecD [Thermaerobacter sp.]|nr:protein translocase subunit SecD [Thermaerobacter sp.]